MFNLKTKLNSDFQNNLMNNLRVFKNVMKMKTMLILIDNNQRHVREQTKQENRVEILKLRKHDYQRAHRRKARRKRENSLRIEKLVAFVNDETKSKIIKLFFFS